MVFLLFLIYLVYLVALVWVAGKEVDSKIESEHFPHFLLFVFLFRFAGFSSILRVSAVSPCLVLTKINNYV